MAAFVNAYNGVKKIYHAEVLTIVAAFFMIIAAILGLVQPTDTILTITGAVTIVSAIAFVIAFFIQMSGLNQAGKDHQAFKTAFWIVIIAIVLGIAGGVLESLKNNTLKLAGELISTFTSLSSIFVIVFTISGISALSPDKEFAAKGNKISWAILILYAVSFIISVVVAIFTDVSDTVVIVFGVLALIASLIDFIIYINIFFYYKKAVQVLS